MTIREMREARTNMAKQMRNILDNAEKENRDLTGEEQEQFDKIDADVRAMDNRITREERAAALEAELGESANGEKRPESRAEGAGSASDKEYRKAFGEYLRTGAVGLELRDPQGVVKGASTYAGYLAPVSLERKLISEITAQSVMRQIADVRTSDTDVDIPVVATHPTAYLVAEAASITASTPVFDHIQMKAYKFAARTYISWEALEDVFINYDQFIADEFAQAFAAAEEAYFVAGTGSSQPQGVKAGAGSGVTAASASAITAEEVMGLVYAVAEKYRRNGAFLMKDATLLALRKLKTGDGQYLWQPGLQMGQPDRLLGYPVHTSDSMEAIATGKVPILFGDFKKYRIHDRSGLRIQRLNEVAAATGEVGFVAHRRTDGHLLVQDAVKKLTMA